MVSQSFQQTQSNTPLLFGRGGYNGPNDSSEDDDSRSASPINFGRGGYNAPKPSSSLVNMGRGGYNRGDDDEEEDGRGGYN